MDLTQEGESTSIGIDSHWAHLINFFESLYLLLPNS